MQYPAADQAKAAMADLMSIAKWKAPHASTGAWQAGLDEIDRFYRNDISQSNTGLQPTEGHDGSSNEYNAEQAGFNRSQSLLGAAHEILPPSALTRMSYPVEFELTTKQSGASVLQQDQPAEPLPQPASPVPDPASKSHRPHAATSPDPGYNTLLSKLTQESQSTDVEPSPEPLQTQHQPTCKVAAFNLLQPPTQQAKDLPLSHSPSARPLSKSAHRESTTPLLPKPNALQPLQQTPQWNFVNHVTARPKWTLEPPPPPGLQPAFEGKGKDRGFEADGVGSRASTPLRERSETGGTRVGGVWVSGDGSREGCGELGEEPSVGAEGRGVHGADEERRLGELRVDVTTRDQVADVTACRKGKASDGTGAEREDGTRDSDSNENASSTITHTCAPDAVGANEENEHEERNEHINAPRRDDNTTTLLNPPGQIIAATDPHFNLNAVTTNPPRWSPANNRTFSNARDEIASLKRGRQNASSSSNSSPADMASSPPHPAKKKKKTSREDQSPSVSEPGEEALEQGPPEEPHPEDRDNDHAHPPIPADQEGQVNTADSDPADPDLPPEQFPSSSFSPASSPSSSKKQGEEEKEKGRGKGKEKEKEREKMGEKANEEESTKKRKRSPRPTMSKRELSNLEGTTVEGKLRRRGPQEGRREQSQPQPQPQQRGQKSKERKGQNEGQEDGKGKGKAEGAARRKRQRRA
ncbi:hypothetical protein KC354_g12960 [Hortaea werneckii]|nr:hypothetical protein KC354_g12960 [Hortaea werneckii]